MASDREYRQYAEQCTRMAQLDELASHRDELKAMARAWRILAAEEERIADLVRAVDQLFAAPSTIPKPVPRNKRLRGLIPRLSDSFLFRRAQLQ
jgi:hypothetical protein